MIRLIYSVLLIVFADVNDEKWTEFASDVLIRSDAACAGASYGIGL
jgi:hypothetical protein